MEIIICQTCGSILECTETRCSNCNAAVSADQIFNVSPIQSDDSNSQRFSFFDHEARLRAGASAERSSEEDEVEPDLYVLSRPTIESAFGTKASKVDIPTSTSSRPPAVCAASDSSELSLVADQSEENGRQPARKSHKERIASRKQNAQNRAIEQSAKARALKPAAPPKRFTNKHMTTVAGISIAAIAAFALITLFNTYEISIQFFNPFAPLFVWFASLPVAMKFMVGAPALVGLAAFALFISFVLFSPNGKMSVWEKRKYIPNQFRGEHAEELRILGKPTQPAGLPLGIRNEWKVWKPFTTKSLSLPADVRDSSPHILLAGSGDTGKTRLMASMIVHDIEAQKRAVVIVDSDGKLSDLITRWVATNSAEIAERVTLLEPNQKSESLGYNPLEMPEDGDLQSAANAIVYGFKAIYTEQPGAQNQWSQQTANILRNAAMLLMANGRTLTDLPALLNDNDFRDVLLESVEKRKSEKAEFLTLLETWATYKRLARSEQWIPWVEPILNRVTPMLSDARIRSILTKPVSDINLKKLIKQRRILIVKVPKGKLDQNGNLLGSLIVTGVKQAAIALSDEAGKGAAVSLYLDEFDNFMEKETFESITQNSEELKIGLIGSLRSFQILPEDFRNQLIIGFNTLCCFTLIKKDADMLGTQMFRVDGKKVKVKTLQNILNPISTAPQFEQVTDEEKLNSDRLVGQRKRNFFCYRVGTAAGVFSLRTPDFDDIQSSSVDSKIIAAMRCNC